MSDIINFDPSIYNLESIYNNIIEKYFKFANILKLGNLEEIKIFIENNNNILTFHKYFFKYEIFFVHYLFMNPNLNIEMINYLIEKNIKLSYENEAYLILYYLFESNFDKNNLINILKYLKSKSYDFSNKDSENNNVYHYLIKNKNVDNEIYELLYTYSKEINATNNDGNTPILLSCQINNNNFSKFLLEKNCDITIKNNNNNNCLMFTCMNNNYELSKLLIVDIDVNLEDNQKDTSLFYACGCDNYGKLNIDLIKLLIEYKSDYNKVSEDGFSVLHYAGGVTNKLPDFNILSYLLSLENIKIDYIDNFHFTFIDYIFEFNNDKVSICKFIKDNNILWNNNNLKNSILIKNYKIFKELEILKKNNIEFGDKERAIQNLIDNIELITLKTDINTIENKCNICHDNFISKDIIITCNNKHSFHKECIYKWFNSPKKYLCPFCFELINLSKEYIF